MRSVTCFGARGIQRFSAASRPQAAVLATRNFGEEEELVSIRILQYDPD
jgi:hypothetical protein